jgi:hypothetical protein
MPFSHKSSSVQKEVVKRLEDLPLTEEIWSVAIGADGGILLACRSVDHKSPSWTYTGSTGIGTLSHPVGDLWLETYVY